MLNYSEFRSEDNLHITSFNSTRIIDIASMIVGQFNLIGKNVNLQPSEEKDTVQLDKRNKPDMFITRWWQPKTTPQEGIAKVFEAMKNDWV
jgi:nucleoside-diphosphate-sugar epimerase